MSLRISFLTRSELKENLTRFEMLVDNNEVLEDVNTADEIDLELVTRTMK